MSGVVELNFGPGLFDANGKDLIMEVPLEGRLGHFFPKGYSEASEAHSQLSHYLDPSFAEPHIFLYGLHKTNRKIPTVRFSLPDQNPDSQSDLAMIMWIEERKEWIAVEYHRWREDCTRDDDSYYGPFGLDGGCESMLAKAYDLCVGLDRDIKSMNPKEMLELYISRYANSKWSALLERAAVYAANVKVDNPQFVENLRGLVSNTTISPEECVTIVDAIFEHIQCDGPHTEGPDTHLRGYAGDTTITYIKTSGALAYAQDSDVLKKLIAR